MACTGSGYRAPVEDRYARSKPTPGSHSVYRVQRGETLYSIAFRYGLDYRMVAAANKISTPYTIYVGQTLQLREASSSTSIASHPSTGGSQQSSSGPSPPSSVQPLREYKSSASKSTVPSDVVTKPPAPSAAKAIVAKLPTKTVTPGPVSSWQWPSTGKVTRSYSSSVHKGIDISGRRGDAVKAVAAGQVVYAGAGIVGLGELLIIKHNELYLSAYGHNSRLLVGEGDIVKPGQRIAEKGSSGTDTVKLHFEIRKEGKPIDPLRLLPRR